MAELDRALQTLPDGQLRPVALKRLKPPYNDDEEFLAMLADEARMTERLCHPNVVRTYELCEVEGQRFLVLEYVDGVDLRTLLRRLRARDEHLPERLAAYILAQALHGLHAAHELCDPQGQTLELIHRDFSPSNLLVSYSGEVKLIDFGVAKANLNRTRTRGGILKGKVKYMSPEQTEGRRLDRRSDVFAAGVVLFEALTGELPFQAVNDAAQMVAIREAPPRPLAGVNEALAACVHRALAKAPADRFGTALDFALALERWLEDEECRDGSRTRPTEPYSGRTAAALQVLLSRVFARERSEQAEAVADLDLDAQPGDQTPTPDCQSYSRLMEPQAPEEVDAWLKAKRDGAWTADAKPAWVEDE